MTRHIMSQLQAWKIKKNRKPLILKGARQVGKTYSLKAFGQKAYDQVVYLNFETQLSLHSLFMDPHFVRMTAIRFSYLSS